MKKTLKLINHPAMLADNKQVVYLIDYVNYKIELHCDLTNEELAIIWSKNTERIEGQFQDMIKVDLDDMETDEEIRQGIIETTELKEEALEALEKAIENAWDYENEEPYKAELKKIIF